MIVRLLRGVGLRSDHFYAVGLGSIGLCLALWAQAKAVDQEQRANAERRALFVGLWPPTFILLGNALHEDE